MLLTDGPTSDGTQACGTAQDISYAYVAPDEDPVPQYRIKITLSTYPILQRPTTQLDRCIPCMTRLPAATPTTTCYQHSESGFGSGIGTPCVMEYPSIAGHRYLRHGSPRAQVILGEARRGRTGEAASSRHRRNEVSPSHVSPEMLFAASIITIIIIRLPCSLGPRIPGMTSRQRPC